MAYTPPAHTCAHPQCAACAKASLRNLRQHRAMLGRSQPGPAMQAAAVAAWQYGNTARAVARAAGVSHTTVQRWLRVWGA